MAEVAPAPARCVCGAKHWWRARPNGTTEWTTCALATRFARREDAEAMIRHLWRDRRGIEATDHLFGFPGGGS